MVSNDQKLTLHKLTSMPHLLGVESEASEVESNHQKLTSMPHLLEVESEASVESEAESK